MKFSTKIFLAIFLTTTLTCFSGGTIIYYFLKRNIEKEYILRYQTYGNIIANTFNQMESSANLINENAVRLLYEIEKNSKIPSDIDLNQLANNLGIKAFYVINKNGKFIRSTDLPLKMQTNSLFSYCDDYHLLVNGNAALYRTPIIPGFPYNIPMKLTMIPNHNRTLILESGMELNYIGNILHQVIKNDSNILSIGIYTPTGIELGFITAHGKYHRGRKNTLLNFKDVKQNEILHNNDLFIFNKKIPTTDPYCCECSKKKISSSSGTYFYILRMKVSHISLAKSVALLRNKILLTLILACLLSTIFSKILAKKLVSRIEKISKTASDIIESNNLNIRVDIKSKSDEISKLADTFNKMIQSLKVSQSKIVESEKKSALLELAAKVAHDIHSPLIAMDMALQQLSNNVPENHFMILTQGIQGVRDIANNMLNRYRNQDDEQDLAFQHKIDDGNVIRPILLSSLAEMMISQKRHEWCQDPCELTLTIKSEATFCWVEIAPNEVKRLLSNLLNNAYDALLVKKQGRIHIMIGVFNDTLYMQIHDNGVGIHPDKISDVLNGVSTKHNGKGLGISSAKHYMEKISGKLEIESMINHGTTINLSFLCANNPIWFPEKISLHGKTTVAVLDDDFSMLMYWHHRINDIGLSIKLFSSYDKILEWVKDNHEFISSTIFLVDYELAEKGTNGLLFLEKINVSNSYLITSHANEFNIQKEVEKVGVCLIPKSLVTKMALV
ncbi:MAG TPA: HAMP domain-containing sensor histidine kinase [Candidatus Saccharimonadales bacterium]|nr:HAMP domain-containing sensor histidine kinase [Candidatus Saccharimonadales bacterium]